VKLTVRVPATVANLGPGFDSFGLALSLFNEIEIDTDAEPGVEIEGEGAGEIPDDDSNLIVRVATATAETFGDRLPAFSLRCMNRIPLERGLGSSAAAAVGGVMLAARLLERDAPLDLLLTMAADVEGHADNAAAALYGGFTITYREGMLWRHAERLDPHPSLHPVVMIPEVERVSTQAARRALPEDVAREDSVFNASHAALLVIALTERPELLVVAMQDHLH